MASPAASRAEAELDWAASLQEVVEAGLEVLPPAEVELGFLSAVVVVPGLKAWRLEAAGDPGGGVVAEDLEQPAV